METTALSQVTELAFQILTPIVTALAAWLAHRFIRVIEKKANIDVPAKQEAKIDEWVAAGIQLAAEKSYQKVKAQTDKLSGSEKLETAADFVLGFVTAQGWHTWTKDKIKSKIEARLPSARENGGVT
jgi:hypothetical protein